jgi:aspartate racemase
MKKTIGVLGGIGPESSALFYTRLISKFKERHEPRENTDYPHIIIDSIPAPELTMGENAPKIESYINGLKLLEKNSDFIIIVCNTAYSFFEDFKRAISKPILDLRDLVLKNLKDGKASKILVLASPNSVDSGLFSFAGIEVANLDNATKNLIGEIISRINLGTNTAQDLAFIEDLIHRLEPEVDVILIACTELSTLLKDFTHPKKVDTLELMVDATLDYYESLS